MITFHEANTALSDGDYLPALQFLMHREEQRLVETIAPPPPVFKTPEQLTRTGELNYDRKLFEALENNLIARGDHCGLTDLRFLQRDFEELANENERLAMDALARSSQTGHGEEDEEEVWTNDDVVTLTREGFARDLSPNGADF